MLKFIMGFTTCAVIVTALYFADILRLSDREALGFQFSKPWSNTATNFKLESENPPERYRHQDMPPRDFPSLALTTNHPLVELSGEDLKRVCINPQIMGDEASFMAEINLTPESRRQFGNALLASSTQEASIRLFGDEINSFFVDKHKAKAFVDASEIYDDEPDILFLVDQHALFTSFTTLKRLLHTETFESCYPSAPLEDFPPYIAWRELWNGASSGVLESENATTNALPTGR